MHDSDQDLLDHPTSGADCSFENAVALLRAPWRSLDPHGYYRLGELQPAETTPQPATSAAIPDTVARNPRLIRITLKLVILAELALAAVWLQGVSSGS